MEDLTQTVEQISDKQKQFINGVPFRVGTERTSDKRYLYQKQTGFIVDNTLQRYGDVLEIAAYSVKVKLEFLGTPIAVYVRFENIIFNKP